jgi:serralysin
MASVRNSAIPRVLCGMGSIAFALALFAPTPARAAFHLWKIDEVYTNSTGSLQFIELTDPFGGSNFVNGQSIQVSNVGNTLTNIFTIPGSSLPGSTLNHTLLLGTAGVHAAGGPTPDYIIPNDFLFTGGGTISFFGTNSGPYTALPTDGLLSRDFTTGTNATNSPENFTGLIGTISPEPASLTLMLAIGGFGLLRRRAAAPGKRV